MAFSDTMVKLLVRSFLLIVGISLLIASIFFILNKAAPISNGKLMVHDPVLLVVGFTILMIGIVTGAFGARFDEMNQRNYELFVSLKESWNMDKSRSKWSTDRILFTMLSWADRNHDEASARRWICFIYFLAVLILLPLLTGLLLAFVIVWLETIQVFGILGVFGLLIFVCLILYAWKFKSINVFVLSALSATIGNHKEDYNARINAYKLIFIILCVVLVLSLLSMLAGKFVLDTNPGSDAVKSDVILGTWTDIEEGGKTSSITFNEDGTFSWSEPLVYSRTGHISGSWTNTSDGVHLTYRLTYADDSTGKVSTTGITLKRSYYHMYGQLVTAYPYFKMDDIPGSGPFSNPDSPHTSVPDVSTVTPSPSPSLPRGQDVLVGTWKIDQGFDWYWMFDSNGSYHSSLGGASDKTGRWTSIGTHRYQVNYTDGGGIVLDYKDEKLYNEYKQQVTFSRVSYEDLNL